MTSQRPLIREQFYSSSERNPSPEAVYVWMLGGFRVSVGDREIEASKWPLKKAASLAKLLALSPGHRLHREVVMYRLWPELGSGAAANNLRQVLHVVRRAFDPHLAGSRYVSVRDREIILCPDGRLWVDVDAFEEVAETARLSKEPAVYRVTAELYAGDLLPEDRYEDWAEERSRELQESYLTLLLELAELYEEREEYGRAIEALKSVVATEAAREEAHVGLMRLYSLAGQRNEALRQYGRFEDALRRELGAEPYAYVRRLHEEILAGRFPPHHREDHRSEVAPDTALHKLPRARDSFVGRERDIVEIKRVLSMTAS